MNVHTKPGQAAGGSQASGSEGRAAAVRRIADRAGLRGAGFLRRRRRPAAPAGALPAGRPRAQLEPHFERLGVLAGGRLDELARTADKQRAGAAPARPLRPRRGLDRVPPGLPRDGGDRLRRFPVPRHEPPRRRARPRRAAAAGRQVRLPVSVRAGRVRHHVPDQRHRHLDLPDPQVREPGAEGLPAAARCCRPTRPCSGRARSS